MPITAEIILNIRVKKGIIPKINFATYETIKYITHTTANDNHFSLLTLKLKGKIYFILPLPYQNPLLLLYNLKSKMSITKSFIAIYAIHTSDNPALFKISEYKSRILPYLIIFGDLFLNHIYK